MKQRHCLLPSDVAARIEPEVSDPDCCVAGSRCNPVANWLMLIEPVEVELELPQFTGHFDLL